MVSETLKYIHAWHMWETVMLVNFGQKPVDLVTNPETVFIKADSVSI